MPPARLPNAISTRKNGGPLTRLAGCKYYVHLPDVHIHQDLRMYPYCNSRAPDLWDLLCTNSLAMNPHLRFP